MKQIYIIEMACPSWRYRADREELKTIKYNLERHPDFKVDQSNININIDGILAGECCMYVCLFVCLFVCFFWPRISDKIGIPSLPKISHGFTDCFVWRLRSCPFGKRSLPFVKHLDLLLRVFLLKTQGRTRTFRILISLPYH